MDGIEFASRKEANRYSELKLKERAGLISDLKLQVKYELVPTQYYHDGSCARAITYYADFEYKNEYGETVVEDVKGYKDPSSVAYRVFTIKKKLMLYRYDITITEV